MHKCFSFFNNGLLLIANQALREMCPNTEFFLVRIFLFSDWIQEKYEPEKTAYIVLTFHGEWPRFPLES